MLRREEMDFLDDVKLSEASEALGLPILPVEQDGFALFDAMAGELPALKAPQESPVSGEFYRYNQNG